MKVNTDGVLLGALMTVRASDMSSLDVGTGTGTIALMAAQRLSDVRNRDGGKPPLIVGIDIDEASAREAAANFAASPWPGMLQSVHSSLDCYARSAGASCRFDHIFSNPPYYDLSLRAPDSRRNAARHTDSLSYRELVSYAAEHLAEYGILSLILPADSGLWLMRYAGMSGLYPFRIVRIRTTTAKQPSRIVAEFSASRPDNVCESLLTIHDGSSYSDEYLSLTQDFYL